MQHELLLSVTKPFLNHKCLLLVLRNIKNILQKVEQTFGHYDKFSNLLVIDEIRVCACIHLISLDSPSSGDQESVLKQPYCTRLLLQRCNVIL